MTLLRIQLPCPVCFALIIYLLGKVICDKLVAGGNKLVNAESIWSSHVRPSPAQMFCKRFRDCFAGSQPLRWISCMLTRNNGNNPFLHVLSWVFAFSFLHPPPTQSFFHAQRVRMHKLNAVFNLQHGVASDMLLFSFKASCSIFTCSSHNFSSCTH